MFRKTSGACYGDDPVPAQRDHVYEPPAKHCEISMLANIRRICEACQPPKCNRMGSFRPAGGLIPVCGITLGNSPERVYNQAEDRLCACFNRVLLGGFYV